MPSPDIEPRPIFLIGFMGAGKSTVGPLLAQRLGWPFIDLDEEIEREAQATIAEVFAGEGEQGFRAREASALARLATPEPRVIAVGGGAPCHGDNLELMRGRGVVVYLRAGADELARRLGQAQGRPLLDQVSDVPAEVARLMGLRAADYGRAHLSIDTEGAPPSAVARRVAEALAAWR